MAEPIIVPMLNRKPANDAVLDGEGCWSCPHWDSFRTALGHCWAPNEKLLAVGSQSRSGWVTCSSYICPAHPCFKREAKP